MKSRQRVLPIPAALLPDSLMSASVMPASLMPASLMSASLMAAELAWASWETIARRTLMIAQSTCSPAEYQKMLSEKTAAAMEIGAVLASPMNASAAALLQPWHSRATANAKRLRR